MGAAEALLGRAADAPIEQLSTLATQVLDLVDGPLFVADEALPALLSARERWQARWVRELASIGERLERAGRAEAAVAVYRRAVEQDPLAEALTRRLMSALAALGRRAEAFEAYRRCRSQLSILLGVRPAPATEALAATLRDD